MRLIIENRTPHRAEIFHARPDGRPLHRIFIPPNDERVLPLDSDKPGSTEKAIATVIEDLSVFGLISADAANRYDAGSGLHHPKWRGWCYRIEV